MGKATHICPAEDCNMIIVVTRAFCLRHWKMVPRSIQTRISIYWRHVKRGLPGAKEKHQTAIKEAITAIAKEEGLML